MLCLVHVRLEAVPITLGEGTPPGNNANLHNMSYNATHSGPKALAPASGGTTQICVFCHTPHGSTPESVLWGRPDPDSMGTYPLYGRPGDILIDDDSVVAPLAKYGTANGATEYPNGATKLCLSCHDGVTSIGTLVDGTVIAMGSGQDTITNASKFFGTGGMDFSKTHPVSFVYSSSVQGAINTNSDPNKNGMYTYPATRILLDSQERVQCTTCHDPHLDTEIADGTRGGGTYQLPFWRKYTGTESTDYDAVCQECHVGGSGGTIRNPAVGGTHNL